ncbi:hypothetical protein BH23BAC1_BH23BAC1_17580 [soil metagenome]
MDLEVNFKPTFLSEYSDFLLDSPILNDLIFHNLSLNQHNNPLFYNYLIKFSGNDIPAYYKNFVIINILKHISARNGDTGNGDKNFRGNLNLWSIKILESVDFEQLEEGAIKVFFRNFKLSLIEFLEEYSSDLKVWKRIMIEMENYFSIWKEQSIEALGDLKYKDLSERDNLLNGILNNLPVIITKIDNEGFIRLSLGQGLKSVGLSDHQNGGKNLFEVSPNATFTRIVLNERIPQIFEGTHGNKTFKNYFFPYEQGGVIGFSLDISEQKEMEQMLKEKEYFIKRIADSTPSHIYVFDYINNQSLYNNRDLLEFLGYSQEMLQETGLSLLPKIIHPEDLPKIYERQKKYATASDDDIIYLEYRVKNGVGEWRWHGAYSRIFKRTEDGKVWQVLGIAQDITERKNDQFALEQLNKDLQEKNEEYAALQEELKENNLKLEERVKERTQELKEKELFLSSLIYQSPISTWVADHNGTMIMANNASLRLFDINNTTLSINIYNLYKDKNLFEYKELIEKVFTNGKIAKFTHIYSLKKKSSNNTPSKKITITTTIFPIRDGNGKITNAVIQNEDISQRKIAEQEKERYYQELIKTNEDLDNFIYTASHELKAPVANMEGLVYALKRALLHNEDDLLTLVEMIERSTQKFKVTIQYLTEISKVQRNIHEEVEELNIKEITEEVLKILDPVKLKDARISIDYNDCSEFRFSRENFKNILMNLLSNALKYNSPDRQPEVKLDFNRVDNLLNIKVADNGLGIKKEHQAKLFSMFRRFHPHIEGSGIGLYLVKRIVQNSGGRIEIESQEGVGSTFSIFLKFDSPSQEGYPASARP